MIDALERKILRQISGPIHADSVHKIKCEEIYKLYDDMALLTFLLLKKLQRTHHTGRMDDPCIPTKIMVCFRGKNPMGGPTGRSEHVV
jgi:hypothetical protein